MAKQQVVRPQKDIIGDYIRKQVGRGLNPSPTRALAYDYKKTLAYMMQKGLRKPGRISFDVLRRASYSVHIARICINVLKEKVTKTEWNIQPINPLAKVDQAKVEEVKEHFKHPNKSNDTFRTMLDKMLEDLLVLDAVSLEKTRYPDGKLAELHYIDAATIRPVFDEYGNQDVEIPLGTIEGERTLPVSYLQVMNNSQYGGPESGDIIAAWPKKDFIYFCMHPQGAMEKFGYGMSPLESVLSVVANLLNADNYNGAYFEEGSMPPVILQLIGNMNERDLNALKENLYAELQASFHRPAIMAGPKEIKPIMLKPNTNKDMEFMQYMTFMAKLMAAAYGLAGQDIGLTEDLNRAISETQKQLSEAKGYSSVLHLLKEVFNQEIIWKDFGYTDIEFAWVQPDTTDPKEAMVIYDQALKNGTMTLNEVRDKLGETPYEEWADKPMVLSPSGYIPIIATPVATADKVQTPLGTVDTAKKEAEPEHKVVGGEVNYNEEAEREIHKSVYTDDGYKTYLDDRGYSQPFIFYKIQTNEGFVIKPPVAVNVNSQSLEQELTLALKKAGANVAPVKWMPYVDIFKNILPTDRVRQEFINWINMTPEYDSERWRAKFGGSRKYPGYLVAQYVHGRNLKDALLIEDMKRDPDSYKKAIKDLAKLWKLEKQAVLGDRRPDQYIITEGKRAYGIDYQFAGDFKRWDDTKNAVFHALSPIPALQKFFSELTTGQSATERIKSVIKKLNPFSKGSFVDSKVLSPEQSFEQNPVMFGELITDVNLKESVKNLFQAQSSAMLLQYGYTEKTFVHDFPQAKKILVEFVQKNPKGYGGIVTMEDITGKKYFVYVKEYSV